MRIGIVGTGNMGRALGLRCAEAGHEICFGARRREIADAAAALSAATCTTGTPAEAARFGPAVLWTVPDQAPAAVVGDPVKLPDRVVIDLTNGPPLAGGGARAHALQAGLAGAGIVKAFNTSSFESLRLTRDEARAQGVQTLLAGDDPAAPDLVAGLAQDLGMDPIGCGPLTHAADLEAVARVLIGQILKREEFLLHLAITSLKPPSHPSRLGARSAPKPPADPRHAGAGPGYCSSANRSSMAIPALIRSPRATVTITAAPPLKKPRPTNSRRGCSRRRTGTFGDMAECGTWGGA